MAKGTGGTIYLIGLIFAIVVAFLLLGVAYYMNTGWKDTSDKLTEMQKKWERADADSKRLAGEVSQLNKIINGEPSGVTYDSIATAHLVEANRKLQEVLSEEWVAAPEWQAIKDPTVKDIWDKLTQFKDKSDKYTNLIDFQTDCLNIVRMVIHVVPRLRLAQYDANEMVKNLQKQIEDAKAQREVEVREANQKFNKLQDESIDNQRKAEVEKKRLQDQVELARKETVRVQKEHVNQVARLDSEIKKKQLRIDELTRKQRKTFYEASQSDGEITFADNSLGYAWVDLGKRHGLRIGMRFDIFQYTKGGRQKIKALCEVKKVEQDMAQVAILNDEVPDLDSPDHTKHQPDPNDPIVKGDLVRSIFSPGNPTFDKEAQRKFYFLGTKLANRYYTQDELTKKIEEFGGKVLKELTVDVDYVVVILKGNEDPKYEQAVQLGATFLREDELLDYIGR
jgi:hypothetical protein